MTKAEIVWPATVFFDGACPVCAHEIEHYRSREHHDKLRFVDISAPDFVPEFHGKSLQEFMARLQVADGSGTFYEGVAGFQVIWSALPEWRYRLLCAVVDLPGISHFVGVAYRVFAANRHRLSGRKDCRDRKCGTG